MEVQHVLVALLLGLIVVLGLSTALIVVTDDTGSEIDDTGTSFGDQINCILSNKKNARDDCEDAGTEDSSVERHGALEYEA